MRQAAACGFSGQPLSRCAALPSRAVLLAAVRHRRHAAQAAQAGGQGAGGGAVQPRRESVTFVVPGRADPDRTHLMRATHVTRRSLRSILDKTGALGFKMDDGSFSDQLEDLPEGGTVQLFMPPHWSTAEQVRAPGCPVPCSPSTACLLPAAYESSCAVACCLVQVGVGHGNRQAPGVHLLHVRMSSCAVVCFTA